MHPVSRIQFKLGDAKKRAIRVAGRFAFICLSIACANCVGPNADPHELDEVAAAEDDAESARPSLTREEVLQLARDYLAREYPKRDESSFRLEVTGVNNGKWMLDVYINAKSTGEVRDRLVMAMEVSLDGSHIQTAPTY